MNVFQTLMNRRRFLKTSAAAGATGAAVTGFGSLPGLTPVSEALAQTARGQTVVTKNICAQCPARCGIDVYTTDGRVHGIYGDTGNPIANGKLCPKGHLGAYFLYDPDRFKGPMKRTNPNKGRNEDPGFVPISWDEALDTIAARLQSLRDKGESHRFAHFYGRGWGASDAGLYGDFGKLYGTPNSAIGHASMCAEGSKKAKHATDGNNSYNSYDYRNTNYILNFGASFLEAFRPYNYLMQVWGEMRSKSPQTRITTIDVRMNPTMAASDRAIYIKPATDGAMALAIAHVILTEGLWDREFVGDFNNPNMRFRTGQRIPFGAFNERWTHGLIEWWNEELKDRTPEWAESVTTVSARDIVKIAQEFGTTRPAMAIMERGPTSHTNGTYNGMAIHALNALVGCMFAEKGGMFYQMGPSYGGLPVNADDFLDDWSRDGSWKSFPRIDKARTAEWPMTSTMMQEAGPNHLKGDPYKLDTAMFFYTNPIWTAPNPQVWEEALKDVFVIDTSPFPGETAMYADIVVPDHTYLERLQDSPTYPFEGYPMTALRVPAVNPIYDTKHFGDVLIEIGKRMNGPMGDFYKALDNVENVLRHRAKGFEKDPGDNGVNSFETWKEKGVWYKKRYNWIQKRGIFYEWDGNGYNTVMTEDEVKDKLLKTPSGKFEFKSGYLENHAEYINRELQIPVNRVGLIQWVEPKHTGQGDLYFVSPKTPLHAEGRSGNIPHAIANQQPIVGGRNTIYLEIHPDTARTRNIRNGDKVRIKSHLGSIEAYCRYMPAHRPDTIVLPMEHGHWAQGRWAKDRLPGHSGELTANVSDPISGLACYYTGKVSVERA